jgi:hypothetical protein
MINTPLETTQYDAVMDLYNSTGMKNKLTINSSAHNWFFFPDHHQVAPNRIAFVSLAINSVLDQQSHAAMPVSQACTEWTVERSSDSRSPAHTWRFQVLEQSQSNWLCAYDHRRIDKVDAIVRSRRRPTTTMSEFFSHTLPGISTAILCEALCPAKLASARHCVNCMIVPTQAFFLAQPTLLVAAVSNSTS